MALGARIRYYRLKLGWTLDDLSTKSMVDIGTISALENRDSRKSEFSHQIAVAFGLTSEQLADDTRDWLDASIVERRGFVYPLAVGEERAPWWPFRQIDLDRIRALSKDDLVRLEAGVLISAGYLGLDVRTQADPGAIEKTG
jgi:transcriptional regulator with XRE-family HTH domain